VKEGSIRELGSYRILTSEVLFLRSLSRKLMGCKQKGCITMKTTIMSEIAIRPYFYLSYEVDLRLAPSTPERALRVLRKYRHEIYLAWKAWVYIRKISPEETVYEDERREKIEYYKKTFYQADHLVEGLEESSWKGGWTVLENMYGGYSPYHCTGRLLS